MHPRPYPVQVFLEVRVDRAERADRPARVVLDLGDPDASVTSPFSEVLKEKTTSSKPCPHPVCPSNCTRLTPSGPTPIFAAVSNFAAISATPPPQRDALPERTQTPRRAL